MNRKLTVWEVTREYAGIAEAGGVKNVSCSLAENLVKNGVNVTVFMPFYGCTMIRRLSKIEKLTASIARINCNGTVYKIAFSQAEINGVRIVFVMNMIFTEKKSVYVYTAEEERKDSSCICGHGHKDANIMNVLFQKAVIAYSQLSGEKPDIVQCQDAHTALLPAFAKASPAHSALFAKTKFFITIHNAGPGYHQQFNSIEEAYAYTGLPLPLLQTGLLNGQVEPFLVGASFAKLFTVSPWYAEELSDPKNNDTAGLSAAFFEKKIKIEGITNGIDFSRYTPTDKTISLLPYEFNPAVGKFKGKTLCRNFFLKTAKKGGFNIPGLECFGSVENKPHNIYFSYHGRIVHQKGLEILADAAEMLLERNPDCCFMIMGQGDRVLENTHIMLAEKYDGRYMYIRGYDRAFVRLCVASADFLVLPSFFEPCGLEDFIGQIFGTIPIAHATGGLKKIIDGKTGFLYKPNEPEILAEKMYELAEKKRKSPESLKQIACYAADYVFNNYSWKNRIEQHYLPMYFSQLEKQ